MEYNIIGFPGISMGLFSEHGPCLEHDHETLRPIIVSTWMPEKVGGLPGKSLVFAESQVDIFSLLFFFCWEYSNVFKAITGSIKIKSLILSVVKSSVLHDSIIILRRVIDYNI